MRTTFARLPRGPSCGRNRRGSCNHFITRCRRPPGTARDDAAGRSDVHDCPHRYFPPMTRYGCVRRPFKSFSYPFLSFSRPFLIGGCDGLSMEIPTGATRRPGRKAAWLPAAAMGVYGNILSHGIRDIPVARRMHWCGRYAAGRWSPSSTCRGSRHRGIELRRRQCIRRSTYEPPGVCPR